MNNVRVSVYVCTSWLIYPFYIEIGFALLDKGHKAEELSADPLISADLTFKVLDRADPRPAINPRPRRSARPYLLSFSVQGK